MIRAKMSVGLWLILAALPLSTSLMRADISDTVTLGTAPLIGDVAGPFSLYFQFTDGSGTGDGNNTVTLSDIQFGTGGGPSGAPSTFGGVSGDLSSQVVLTDSSFFNYFEQGFTPGDELSFTLDSTTNVDAGPIPDAFSFEILDSTGFPIPTTDPFSQLLGFNIDSPGHTIQTFATDPTQTPVAGGPPIDMSAPQVTPTGTTTAVVPEPSSLALVAVWFVGLAFRLTRTEHRMH
jgi:hypothetical protein